MSLIRPLSAGKKWPQKAFYPILSIHVREFVPTGDDITSERWSSGGQEIILELPCLAAAKNDETTKALETWIDHTFEYYALDMRAQAGDYLTSATFDEALRYAEKQPVSITSNIQLFSNKCIGQHGKGRSEDLDRISNGAGVLLSPERERIRYRSRQG
jgi:hypothetical protein